MSRSTRDRNRKPTHPGEIIRLDVLPELEITQDVLAQRLGVSRLTVSQLLHGHRSVTASMAVRLERVLGTRAELWLSMQQAVDLWKARREEAQAMAARTFVGDLWSVTTDVAATGISVPEAPNEANILFTGDDEEQVAQEPIPAHAAGFAWTTSRNLQ